MIHIYYILLFGHETAKLFVLDIIRQEASFFDLFEYFARLCLYLQQFLDFT